MKEKKEPLKLKLTTVVFMFIILLIVVVIAFFYIVNNKTSINQTNEIEKSQLFDANNTNTSNTTNSTNSTKTQQLNIDDKLVQELYNYILKYSDYEETLVYQSQKVTSETMDNKLKLMTVFENLSASDADDVTNSNEYGIQITHYLYKAETVEKKAREIFGNNSSITHEDCPIYFTKAIDYKNGIYDCYDYQGGGRTPWEGSISKLKTAEQNGDEIYIYDQYIHVYDVASETASDEGLYTTSDKKTKISDLINISLSGKDQRQEEAFAQYEEKLGNKIQTFKHTFKKNLDGSYYWYSTEPTK